VSDLSQVFEVEDILVLPDNITALSGGDSEKNRLFFPRCRFQFADRKP